MIYPGESRNYVPSTTQVFEGYHAHLQFNYRDYNGEYPANCREIALNVAEALLQERRQPSLVRLKTNVDSAPVLRPSVYLGKVEWLKHVVAMDGQRIIHDPMLAEPTPYDEYLSTAFLDNNAHPFEVIEGDMVGKIIHANHILSSLGI